ncbi:agmatine deiminase family protein [Salinimonas marina]|uniref:Agmatine deiminase family protein n=1 Tax=Salinimonas marina TaxID=2785918 RepID=A0A7S9DXQ4_9ALTE|nr:agmatine deiminase family protein [Salinimonas marina]QPG05908.1 agmatine deiminase family protein [Salinimonas marina]
MTTGSILFPEWVDADAVILAWPHEHTDWAPWLQTVRDTYCTIIERINETGAGVILLCPSNLVSEVQSQLPEHARVLIIPASYNDTWVRDYGFLTCNSANGPRPLEFAFNGWGEKFNADEDNRVNRRYLAELCRQPLTSIDWVAEGGALEIDEHGHLLSTAQCLLNPKRNGQMPLEKYQQGFKEALGATRVTILEHGHLQGDDTDGHIDTLVRFTPQQAVVIQACDNRPQDTHFESLTALCAELAQRLPEHPQYRLPLPEMYNQDNERLPASYANFLICNQHILAPVYNQPEDAEALTVLRRAYPQYTVTGIDCSALVQQFGSLHCISMQVPQHTLKAQVISQLQTGVFVYAGE